MNIVCVTSCFSGIVHTYLAAESFRRSGEKLGHKIFVETQGPAGSRPFDQDLIDSADGVIFAVDLEVDGRNRFAGKPYIQVDVAAAINGSSGLIEQLLSQIRDGTAATVEITQPMEAIPATPDARQKKKGFFANLFGGGN